MEAVKNGTYLMLTRRGYRKVVFEEDESRPRMIGCEGTGQRPAAIEDRTGQRPAAIEDLSGQKIKESVVVFFLNKNNCGDKVNVNVFKNLITTLQDVNFTTSLDKEISHIILVHDIPLTSDVKQNIALSETKQHVGYRFESFTFDELGYDLFEALFDDPSDPENLVFCDKIPFKIPIISCKDPLAKYVNAMPGDFLRGRFDWKGDISYRRCLNI